MAHICFKPKGSCKTCEHYHYDEDYGGMSCFEVIFEELKQELLKAEVVASEALPSLLLKNRYYFTPKADIEMLLKWSGDDEYVTADEIISRRNEISRNSVNYYTGL